MDLLEYIDVKLTINTPKSSHRARLSHTRSRHVVCHTSVRELIVLVTLGGQYRSLDLLVSSARKMRSVIVISDDEQDEVNVVHHPKLSSPIPPERFLGNSGSSPQGEQRVKVNLKIGPPGKRKRRRPSDSDVESVEVEDVSRAKKTKKEERKAVSVFHPVSSLICGGGVY